MNKKSKTEEIQYLGQMLTATTAEDKKRLWATIRRLVVLMFAIFMFTAPMALAGSSQNSTATARTYGNTTYLTNSAGNHTGTVTTNGSVTTVVTNNPQTGTVNQGN